MNSLHDAFDKQGGGGYGECSYLSVNV